MEAFYFRRGDFRRGILAYYDASIPDAGGPGEEGFSVGEQAAEQPAKVKNSKPPPAAPAPEPEPEQLVIDVDQADEPVDVVEEPAT